MSLVEIKDLNAPIKNKPFYEQQVKSKQEASKNFIEMSRNDNYATGSLLDYLYHQSFYKLIGIDLRQANTSISQ